MRSLFFAFLFLLPFHVNAESVLQAKGKNFLFQPGMYKTGDILTIFGADGRAKGTARVKQVGKTKSLAEVTSGAVATGDTVGFDTGAATADVGGSSAPGGADRGFKFGGGLTIDLMSSLKASGTYTLVNNTYVLSTSGRSGTGFGLLADVQYWFGKVFGATGGFEFQMERPADAGLTYTATGLGTLTVPAGDKISFMLLTGGAALRFGKFYFPMGINYPMTMTFKPTSGTVQVAGQLGYQFGGGWMITKQMAVELMYRILNYQLRVDSTGGTFIYTKGEMTNMLMVGKFYF